MASDVGGNSNDHVVEGEARWDDWFVVSGTPYRRENVWRLAAVVGSQSVSRDVRISPPWLVAAGFVAPFWNGQTLDTAKARGPVDEAIAAGRDFTAEPAAGGLKPQWLRLFPSVNYTGGDAPGSVDFAAVTHSIVPKVPGP
jgi:hypothetical protein